jgi:hypothetical protein
MTLSFDSLKGNSWIKHHEGGADRTRQALDLPLTDAHYEKCNLKKYASLRVCKALKDII